LVVLLCPGIEATDGTCDGEPCFAGTRLHVSIVAAIAERHGLREALSTYPQITHNDVKLAMAFMAGAKWQQRN
jgi:uncharacterized protein (DUF433 family)